MLGLDRDAAELAGLITGEEENPSRPFCIAFEHPACLRFRVARRASLPSIIRHSLRSGRCLIPAQPPSYDAVCDHKGVSVDVPATIALNYGVMGPPAPARPTLVARDGARPTNAQWYLGRVPRWRLVPPHRGPAIPIKT